MNKSIRTFMFGLAATLVTAQPIAAVDFAATAKGAFNIAGGLATYWAGSEVYKSLFREIQNPATKEQHLWNKDQSDFVRECTKATASFMAKNFMSNRTGSSSPFNKIIFANTYSFYDAVKKIGSSALQWNPLSKSTAFGLLGITRGVVDAFIASHLEGKIDIGSYDFSPMAGLGTRSMTKQFVRNLVDTNNAAYYNNEHLYDAWATVGNIGGALYFTYLKSLQPKPGMFAWLLGR